MYTGLRIKSRQFCSILSLIVTAGHFSVARITKLMKSVSAVLQLPTCTDGKTILIGAEGM